MELKQLQFLVACAQTQSFSKAANQLFTAQSNVSKVIKSLEEELGVELFERKPYGITLTDRGRQIYEYALVTLESARKILDYTKEEIREELRIACNPSNWMAKVFCDYYNSLGRKDVSYHVITASTNEIIRRLANDLDHLGFVYIMEEQLPILQNTFAKNHISFSLLKKTGVVLQFGNEMSVHDYHRTVREQQPVFLVQGYEDEFALKTFLDESDSDEEQLVKHRVAVTTNSDTVMQELLMNTSLGNIRGGRLSDIEENQEQNMISLYGEETPVLFGCLFRNDQNLGKLQRQYLNFIKEQLKEE